jgi:hypothetical protein
MKCPKCDKDVKDLPDDFVITLSRLSDSEIQRSLAPSIIVKVCPVCRAIFVDDRSEDIVTTLLDL